MNNEVKLEDFTAVVTGKAKYDPACPENIRAIMAIHTLRKAGIVKTIYRVLQKDGCTFKDYDDILDIPSGSCRIEDITPYIVKAK